MKLDAVDFPKIESELKSMYRAAKAETFVAFYITFKFKIETSELSDSLRNFYFNKFKALPTKGKSGFNVSGYVKFSPMLNNKMSMLESFLYTLPLFFEDITGQFNADTGFTLTELRLTFKKARRSKLPTLGKRSKRPGTSILIRQRRAKGKSPGRRTLKKAGRKNVKRSGSRRTKAGAGLKKLRRVRRRNTGRVTRKIRNAWVFRRVGKSNLWKRQRVSRRRSR
jgi:hypothetical protein